MLFFFAFTLFVGASLIFLIQPMIARMVLRYYGGSPAVWSTCMLFFQAGLLFGYAYAHAAPTWLGLRRHAVLHLLLMLVPFLLFPIAVTSDWAPDQAPPALWLLLMLVVFVGLPFFLVSSTTPLLQRWFANTQHAAARDPYFLYVASNLGSMLALLAYPVILQSFFNVQQHSWIWTVGYGLLVVLMAGCAVLLWRSPDSEVTSVEGAAVESKPPKSSRKQKSKSTTWHTIWKPRLYWTLLAFIPSSMMISVTVTLTTDIVPVPLLWVMPLAIYLLTFILTFAQEPPLPHTFMQRLLPLMVLLLAIVILSEATEPIWLLILLHLAGLFVIGMVCHGELARSRPEANRLTEFYLWLATGGVLGGLFNAILAPIIFAWFGLIEYPLVLILACFICKPITWGDKKESRRRVFLLYDLLPAVGLFVLALVIIYAARQMSLPEGPIRTGLILGVPAVICYTFLDRPLRYGLAIAALFLAGTFQESMHGHSEVIRRSFFGIYRVTISPNGHFRKLVHGSTEHGVQSLSILPDKRREPLAYYHYASPIGTLIESWNERETKVRPVADIIGLSLSPYGNATVAIALADEQAGSFPPLKDIAVVGLGAGSLAAYTRPGQNWDFYEIDPIMVWIAKNKFTFWKIGEQQLEGKGGLNVILGDARLELDKATDKKYDLLVIDAFTSDAIPLHLLTREALAIYRDRVHKKHGVIAFHISNRYLNLLPVLSELAGDAGMNCYWWYTSRGKTADNGKFASDWVFLANPSDFARSLSQTGLWARQEKRNGRYLWTDDFANILDVFEWRWPTAVP